MTSGQLSIIETYEDNEIPITVTNVSDKSIHYVRVRIGITNGLNILLVSNNKIYITENIKEVSYKEELNIYEIYSAITQLKELESKIGDLAKLNICNTSSLVNVINEMIGFVNTNKHIVGYIDYLAVTLDELSKIEPTDLEIAFIVEEKGFRYYSEAEQEWLVLPSGWQKLSSIVRNKENLTDKLTGVLYDSKVYLNYEPVIYNSIETFGDEYPVRTIIKNNKSGSLIYTPRGYTYIYSN